MKCTTCGDKFEYSDASMDDNGEIVLCPSCGDDISGIYFQDVLSFAMTGDMYAQALTGMCYIDGIGVEENPGEAFEWYMKSAQQGLAAAQQFIGECYDDGVGVEEDPGKAFEWHMKAAQQGLAEAQWWIGTLYEEGEVVDKNPQKAVEWYMKSAQQGNADAQLYLGYFYQDCDIQKALEWYKKAATQGSYAAQKMIDQLNEKSDNFAGLRNCRTTNQAKELLLKYTHSLSGRMNRFFEEFRLNPIRAVTAFDNWTKETGKYLAVEGILAGMDKVDDTVILYITELLPDGRYSKSSPFICILFDPNDQTNMADIIIDINIGTVVTATLCGHFKHHPDGNVSCYCHDFRPCRLGYVNAEGKIFSKSEMNDKLKNYKN